MALQELETRRARSARACSSSSTTTRAYGAEVHHFGPHGPRRPTTVRFPDADLAAIARARRRRRRHRPPRRRPRARRRLGARRHRARCSSTPRSTPQSAPTGSRTPSAPADTRTRSRMSSMSANAAAALLDALADGSVEVVDLTQPLSESTPVLQLPEPFANTPPLSRRTLSRYDDAGPAWAWDVLEIGEHTGTHFDAPIHWITRPRRRGRRVGRRRRGSSGRRSSSTSPPRSPSDPGYLLTVADLEAFEAEHGRDPGRRRGSCSARAGTRAPTTPRRSSTPGREGPVDARARRRRRALARRRARRSSASASRRSAPTRARPAASTRRSPPTSYLLGAAATASRSSPTSRSSRPTGALVVVAPLKLVGGTGSPARVLALVPSS